MSLPGTSLLQNPALPTQAQSLAPMPQQANPLQFASKGDTVTFGARLGIAAATAAVAIGSAALIGHGKATEETPVVPAAQVTSSATAEAQSAPALTAALQPESSIGVAPSATCPPTICTLPPPTHGGLAGFLDFLRGLFARFGYH